MYLGYILWNTNGIEIFSIFENFMKGGSMSGIDLWYTFVHGLGVQLS